jgi:hypothetical protein
MFESCPIKESINSKRNSKKFYKSYPSPCTKELKSFIKYLITHQDNKHNREDNIGIAKQSYIDPM